MTSALILFAHGARDARWALPFEAIAERLRAARPQLQVRLAFLELMSPDLPTCGGELAAAGHRRVDVVPMFLGAGGHVRRDLPQLIDRLRSTHPAIDWRLHPPIGEIDAVSAAMAAACLTLLESDREADGAAPGP